VPGPAIQDLIPHNHCFGCGPDNEHGLRLKSYWDGSGFSVARFVPQAHHCAGPAHFVNGGILATIVDCHCICTAMAAASYAAGRMPGAAPHDYFATASLDVVYKRPTPIDEPLELAAEIVRGGDRDYVLSCAITAAGKETVTATVAAVRVPDTWMHGRRA
jgi:acyl-coenzyme A thioesterase PaaI-like protein